MATIYVGSARHDENGTYTGGAAGDQLQTSSTNDTAGEVSMQKMYTHSKGWYILRPKEAGGADKLAAAMKLACNNANLGYDQGGRGGVITNGIDSAVKTECDCSSLVRACVKYALGTDPGNFTTLTEAATLADTGLFEEKTAYTSQTATPVYNGDVLVTKTKGHTVIVVSGNPRSTTTTTTEEAHDMDTLRNGDTGQQVTVLQKLLNQMGSSLTEDGDFGSKTEAAVKSYQKKQGLTQDGICGPKTWAAILAS
ncbi:MAG: peptidoglycan-binding protein [Clostridiales bacterium]|nr:peptidoglycan-binding protein [Clostridiales bacterium]